MKKTMMVLLAATAVSPLFADGVKHRFLVSNYMGKSLHYVDQFEPANNWNLDMGYAVFDMQLIDGDRLLVNHDRGYHVYDLKSRERVSSFSSERLKGIKSVRRLDDGRTFFSSHQGPVWAFDKDGGFVAEYAMPKAVTYVRMMRFAPNGNVLLACNDGAFECSLAGGLEPEQRLVKKFLLPRPRNSYMALYAPDGDKVYVAGGYSKGFFLYDTEGTLLGERVIEQPEGLHNYFYAGFQILDNGHIVMANWTGHGPKDYKPGLKLVEFDRDFKVVWSWNEEFGGTVNQVIVFP